MVVSNDTDLCVLLLHHSCLFTKLGLTELLLWYGLGTNECLILLHILFKQLDQNLSDVLLEAHVLTEYDCTSKIGTKSSALKYLDICLKDFGEKDLSTSCFLL